MARLSKADELAKITGNLKTFSYNVDAGYYKIPVCVIAANEGEAGQLLKAEYPEAKTELVFKGMRCLIAGIKNID